MACIVLFAALLILFSDQAVRKRFVRSRAESIHHRFRGRFRGEEHLPRQRNEAVSLEMFMKTPCAARRGR